jgi:peptidoglycan/LPS O-acetylase OafA/YrhL
MNDAEAADRSTVEFESRPRSRWTDWLSRRIPSMLGWDGLLPLVSPICTWISAQGPHFLQSVVVTFVPMVVALVRAKIARRQLVRACGNAEDTNRQLALGSAIVLLLVLEVVTSILILGQQVMSWGGAALVYLGYFLCIAYALRPPKSNVADLPGEITNAPPDNEFAG